MKRTHSTTPSLLKICVAAVIGASPLMALAAAPESPGQGDAEILINETDRIIVKYKDGKAAGKHGQAHVPAMTQPRMAILQRAGQQYGVAMKALHGTATGANIVQIGKKMAVADVAALARELQSRDPNVEYAEPDRIMVTQFTPNDPRYGEQWHYFETTGGLRANVAWDVATGSGVNVAVIDTGYRPHADLAGQFVGGYDFISSIEKAADGNGRDSDASDPGDSTISGQCGAGSGASRSSWHGTHVAGTVAARTNNGVGVAGVAFNAKIVPVRVLGKCGGYSSDIADAIIWSSGGTVSGVPANANPARVINMSLGGSGSCGSTTQNAINSARSRGTVVIVAAGNSRTDASGSNPANCAGVVTVAASNRSGGRASYSNYGAVVDVAAPGGDTGGGVLSTLNAGATTPGADSYASYQGTSMATPHVAGVAALMLSKTPGMTPDQIESTLKSTARAFPASCSGCGSGIVDAARAVGATVTPPPPPPPSGSNEVESNNTTGSANSVTVSGTVMNGNMGSASDNDYFVLQLPPGRTLSANLVMASSSADYDLYVYNSNGAQIGSSENPTGQGDTVNVTNTGSATFARYVRVRYYSGGTGATYGRYTLKLSW